MLHQNYIYDLLSPAALPANFLRDKFTHVMKTVDIDQ
jgi:hypothetical protein